MSGKAAARTKVCRCTASGEHGLPGHGRERRCIYTENEAKETWDRPRNALRSVCATRSLVVPPPGKHSPTVSQSFLRRSQTWFPGAGPGKRSYFAELRSTALSAPTADSLVFTAGVSLSSNCLGLHLPVTMTSGHTGHCLRGISIKPPPSTMLTPRQVLTRALAIRKTLNQLS